MSSGGGSATAAAESPLRSCKRNKTRNDTFIIPRTGERSRRQFTLPTSRSRAPPRRTSATSSSNSAFTSTSIEHTSESLHALGREARRSVSSFCRWLGSSDDARQVLKCTLAFLLGTTATLWPPLSGFLGHRDGKHIIATLTVFFHPARTVGSMIEAIATAAVAVVYAELVCLLSMSIAVVSRALVGSAVPAHGVVLVVCIGGGLGFIGWIKQRLNRVPVNTASTLASIAIISVITQEEAVQNGYFSGNKIAQMLKMLLLAITFSVAVNLLVWRLSARKILKQSLVSAAEALSDRVSYITRGFLDGSEIEVGSPEYARVNAQYSAALAQMLASLHEAKLEHYLLGYESMHRFDERLVKSLESISRAIGGLRSSLNTQFTLLREGASELPLPLPLPLPPRPASPGAHGPAQPVSPTSQRQTHIPALQESAGSRLAVIEEDSDEGRSSPLNSNRTRTNITTNISHNSLSLDTLDTHTDTDTDTDTTPVFRAPSDIFALFIALLGPSIKSLAYTLSEILRENPFPRQEDRHRQPVVVNDQLRQSLADALELYNDARGDALQELYRSIELGRARSAAIQADIEEVAAACGHFSFSLQAVAEEMGPYLDALEDLEEASMRAGGAVRTWEWAKLWRRWRYWRCWAPRDRDEEHGKPPQHPHHPHHVDVENGHGNEDELLLPKSPANVDDPAASAKGIPKSLLTRKDTYNWDASPDASGLARHLSQSILKTLRFFSREDVLYGFKVGIGAVLWAMFAFIHSTRPIYQHWRGEWGLLSYMIVMGMTTGASNTTGGARFVGTLIGAASAIVAWAVSQDNPWLIALCSALVAFGNFYVILVCKKAPLGRISLLAYNIIILYAYSLSQQVDDDDDDEGGLNPLIWSIAYHRVIAVTLGIVWGIFVCRTLWPISARRKFREGLAVLYLQLGLIWKRGPLNVLVDPDGTLDFMPERDQTALRQHALVLDSLRESASSEFELRGPFPDAAYARIMQSTKYILNGFYAMRLLLQQRRAHLSDGERSLIEATAAERAMLCERICHVFQVLASSIMLEYPLTDATPTIDRNKDRLLRKVYKFRKDHSQRELGSDLANNSGSDANNSEEEAALLALADEKDFALIYAYTLVTAQVAAELGKVKMEIEELFGVLEPNELLLE